MEEVDTFRRKIIPDNFVQCIRYLDEKTCGNFVVKIYSRFVSLTRTLRLWKNLFFPPSRSSSLSVRCEEPLQEPNCPGNVSGRPQRRNRNM